MSIDLQSLQLIKQTAAAIKTQTQSINRQVYLNLEQEHPAAHAILQHAGFPPLAGIVASYASNVDNLEAFLQHAPKIVQAHRRIDLQESHFSMLADALFKAMRQTLSDEALPDIALQAWRRAYDHLATILIQQQREMATQPTIVIQTTP